MAERRKHSRHDYPLTMDYELRNGSHVEKHKGVVVNLSRTGLCMYLFRYFTKNEEMIIKTTLPVKSRKAKIRWIRMIDVDLYKAGLIFL